MELDIVKEGVLHKWTNYLYGWKKRYFVLHDNLLEYCKNKGDTLKGKISLQTLDIKKHPKKEAELIVDTGVTKIHLRAASNKEAQEWFLALMENKKKLTSNSPGKTNRLSLDDKSPTTLNSKVTEMWKVFKMISESLEKVPESLKKTCAEVKDLVGLCAVFKDIASEALSLLESEDPRSGPSRRTYNKQMSVDYSEKDSIASPKNIFEPFVLEDKEEESVEFQDAQSHASGDVVEEYIFPRRKCLPSLRNPNQKYNIWKVVKDSIGRDLSKMAVPVYYNEPISFLQRFTEDLTYHEIILNASEIEDSCLRLAYVACFGVSSYVSTQLRTMKPFNPLLGETFELVRDGYRIVSEQVSHHPPISAINCEHEKFLFWGSVNVKSSFKGTHLNCVMIGNYHIILKNTGDHFIWSKPQTNVHNIIFGKMYVDHYGKLEVVNSATREKAVLNFHKKGWFEKVSNAVDGIVTDSQGVPRFKVFGQWNERMSVQDLSTNKVTVVWEKYPFPEGYDHNYFFSDFAIQLNMPPEHFPGLPKSDSRFRPDQRALEFGDLKLAVSEKHRVEEKQREARRILEMRGLEYRPMWFTMHDGEWIYSGGYWEARDDQDYDSWPDIF